MRIANPVKTWKNWSVVWSERSHVMIRMGLIQRVRLTIVPCPFEPIRISSKRVDPVFCEFMHAALRDTDVNSPQGQISFLSLEQPLYTGEVLYMH